MGKIFLYSLLAGAVVILGIIICIVQTKNKSDERPTINVDFDALKQKEK